MKNNICQVLKLVCLFFLLLMATTSAYIWYNFGTISPEQILIMDKHTLSMPWVQITSLFIIAISLALTFVVKKYCNFQLTILISTVSFAFFVFVFGIIEYIKNNISYSNFYEEHFVSVNNEDIKFPEQKRNLILVYVEGLDDGYISKEITPFLYKLQEDNMSFTGFYQMSSASNTLKAQFTGLCGMPLKQGLLDTEDLLNFFSTLTCVPDILQKAGYNSSYLKAAYIMFSRADEFAKQHSYDNIKGYDQLKPLMQQKFDQIDGSKFGGMRDKVLFEAAKDELLSLKQPFFLTLTTLDTHSTPTYFLDPDCKPEYNDERDAVKCADNNLKNFVNWLKKQDFYDNTTVIIMGDHLYPKSSRFGTEIYNVVLNPYTKLQPQDHEWTTYDLAPTILTSIGVDVSKLGIGRSLFVDEPTLFEKYQNKFNSTLLAKNKLYQSFTDNFVLNYSFNLYNNGEDLTPESISKYIDLGNRNPYTRITAMSFTLSNTQNKAYTMYMSCMGLNKKFSILVNDKEVYSYNGKKNKSAMIVKNIVATIPEGVIKDDGKAVVKIVTDKVSRNYPFGLFIHSMSIK